MQESAKGSIESPLMEWYNMNSFWFEGFCNLWMMLEEMAKDSEE